MAIGSISQSAPVQSSYKTSHPEAIEAMRGGKEVRNDTDTDTGRSATPASAPKPVTNTFGQTIGRTVNVSA
jgi:hypothetical protein